MMIVIIMPFISNVKFTADLQATQKQSFKKYRAHSATAALTSNEELMNEIRIKTVKSLDTETVTYLDSYFTVQGARDAVEDALQTIIGEGSSNRDEGRRIRGAIVDLMRNQTDSYRFTLRERTEEGYKNRFKVNTTTSETKRFSTIYLASPSENRHRILIGVSDQN